MKNLKTLSGSLLATLVISASALAADQVRTEEQMEQRLMQDMQQQQEQVKQEQKQHKYQHQQKKAVQGKEAVGPMGSKGAMGGQRGGAKGK